jgi:hypothetical protein
MFIKVNVKLSLFFFTWAPRHEGMSEEWVYRSTHSLISALDGGELSASRSGRFIPSERSPIINWIEGWMGPRVGLDTVVKRKIAVPAGNRTLEPQSSSPKLSRYTDWAITALNNIKGIKLSFIFENFNVVYTAQRHVRIFQFCLYVHRIKTF